MAFAEAGARVIGLDVSERVVAAVNRGESHIEDVASDRLAAVAERLTATADHAQLAAADAIAICVPTPLSPQREPDLRPLLSAARAVAGYCAPASSWSSSRPPTRAPRASSWCRSSSGAAGSAAARTSTSPSPPSASIRAAPTTRCATRPKVIGGLTPACAARAEELYGAICDELVPVSSPEAAELEKLLENIFRSVNIALVNELAMLCDRLDIDIWEVVDAAATKPYGFMRFDPGPGMGGHCLPVDPFYLSWKAREVGFATEFIELAGKVNQHMPEYCVERVVRALNDAGKPVNGSRIALLGISYKAGVGDMRESPALKIGRMLQSLGGELAYHDAFVERVPELGLECVGLDAALAGADAVVIITAHPGVDHDAVAAAAALTVDLRGVVRAADGTSVVRL